MWNIKKKKKKFVCGVNIKINFFSHLFRIYIYLNLYICLCLKYKEITLR